MNKISLLLTATLLSANSPVWAEAGNSADLRYCLDLPSNQQIAKCAGEISAGGKHQPLPKEEVDRILSEGKASPPASASNVPATPASASDNPGKDAPPPKAESNSN